MVRRLVVESSLQEGEEPVGEPPITLKVPRRQDLELKERWHLRPEIRLHSFMVCGEDQAIVIAVCSLMDKSKSESMCPSDKKTDDYQYEDVEYYVCFDCPHLDVVVFPSRGLVLQRFDAGDPGVERLSEKIEPEEPPLVSDLPLSESSLTFLSQLLLSESKPVELNVRVFPHLVRGCVVLEVFVDPP